MQPWEYLTLSAVPVAVIIAMLYVIPLFEKWLSVRELHRHCVARRRVVLTYDDGPGGNLTPRLLSLLKRHNAKAAFFVLGQNVRRAPSIVNRIMDDGHEIGAHGDRHIHPWRASPRRIQRDMCDGLSSLDEFKARIRLYRPPYGKLTLPLVRALRKRGLSLAWWTIDSGDTWPVLPDPEEMAARIIARGGGVVLMHDHDRSEERMAYVLRLTELVITHAEKAGVNLAAFSDVTRDG